MRADSYGIGGSGPIIWALSDDVSPLDQIESLMLMLKIPEQENDAKR